MRPILLKSAGLVGLAGVIMATVSGNVLFGDPGGPPRVQRATPAASASQSTAALVSIANAGTVVAPEDDTWIAVPPKLAEADPPRTTGSAAPPEFMTAQAAPKPRPSPAMLPVPVEPPPAPPIASVEAEPVQAAPTAYVEAQPGQAPLTTAAAVAPAIAEVPSAAPTRAPTVATASRASQPPAPVDRSEGELLWPKEATECPRDWVAVSATRSQRRSTVECQTIASLVKNVPVMRSSGSLEKALPERVLDMKAMAPAIPVPPTAAGNPPNATEEPPAAQPDQQVQSGHQAKNSAPDPAPAPKPTRARASADWPDDPPPDCGGGHAYWHFVDRKTHTKEWYCR